MGVTRVGAMPWALTAVLAAGVVAAPRMQAQEVEQSPDGATEEGPQLGVLVGIRAELLW